MIKRLSVFLSALLLVLSICAQDNGDKAVRDCIAGYFASYQSQQTYLDKVTVKECEIGHGSKSITVTVSDNFSRQLFRYSLIDSIKSGLRDALPASFRQYSLHIISNNTDIGTLVPNRWRNKPDDKLKWGNIGSSESPLVRNISSSIKIQNGLSGIHIALTPSHGYYYDDKEKFIWKWQRPSLWCTREDLLTQSFVYPYLIPMLENAGAVVLSMRERDSQTNCCIVDNLSGDKSYVRQSKSREQWESVRCNGFSLLQQQITSDSTAMVDVIRTTYNNGAGHASAKWIPDIPETGEYAVYVTYRTFSNSVPDARYTVSHSGGTTTFLVNQRMGEGSWIYLGTFRFEKGRSQSSMVSLDNESNCAGVVCADAVRFGGGVGTEVRGGSVSSMPRYLEAAKYYAIYNGMPDSVTTHYKGKDEYKDDIQSRPRMANLLSGGSAFNPDNEGKRIPIELCLALHTDAGTREGDSIVGSLGICTTQKKDGILASGLSRQVSRDFTDQLLSDLKRDISISTGYDWVLRGVRDDDYCESREPEMPSALLELLSHQNFQDVKYALDPQFRFKASRAIYKSILRYEAFMHGFECIVQPLPVSHFRIELNARKKSLKLSWMPVNDPLEPTAAPDGYIVFTSIDGSGFDNGTWVSKSSYEMIPDEGHVYSFRVSAVNRGGKSMLSETLSACINRNSKGSILVINGFQRLSGPATVRNDSIMGFDLSEDEGVQYLSSSLLCGAQIVYDRSHAGMADEEELGFSGSELEGVTLQGNSFNYPYIHGVAIADQGEYSFVSCSREAVEENLVSLSDYDMADIILGLQKHTPNDTIMGRDFSAFTPGLISKLGKYYSQGGKILISGAYTGSDLCTTELGRKFARETLGFKWSGSIGRGDIMPENSVIGLNSTYSLTTGINERIYTLSHPDIIEPEGDAIAIFAYSNSRYCAGVAHGDTKGRSITTGFPLESIGSQRERNYVMASLIEYLMK